MKTIIIIAIIATIIAFVIDRKKFKTQKKKREKITAEAVIVGIVISGLVLGFIFFVLFISTNNEPICKQKLWGIITVPQLIVSTTIVFIISIIIAPFILITRAKNKKIIEKAVYQIIKKQVININKKTEGKINIEGIELILKLIVKNFIDGKDISDVKKTIEELTKIIEQESKEIVKLVTCQTRKKIIIKPLKEGIDDLYEVVNGTDTIKEDLKLFDSEIELYRKISLNDNSETLLLDNINFYDIMPVKDTNKIIFRKSDVKRMSYEKEQRSNSEMIGLVVLVSIGVILYFSGAIDWVMNLL